MVSILLTKGVKTDRLLRRSCIGLAAVLLWSQTHSLQAGQEVVGPSLRPGVAFEDYLRRQFHTRHGLPSGYIYDAIQTRDGYLWIATHNGVARYDGFQFRIFNRANALFPSNDTRVLFEGSDGTLWIGTTGGLARLQSGRSEAFEVVSEFLGNSLHAIFEDSTGTLWFGTREQTWQMSDGRFAVVRNAPKDVYAVAEDSGGRIWLGTRAGLYVQEDESYRRLQHEKLPEPTDSDNGVPPAGINFLMPSLDGGVWIGANRGLLKFREGQFQSIGSELGTQRVVDAVMTRSGGLFVAARFGVYRSVDDTQFERMATNSHAICLLEDKEGGLWAGYGANLGLEYFGNSPFQRRLPDATVYCVLEDSDHNMWFGTSEGLVRLTPSGEIRRYGIEDGLPDLKVSTIASNDGRVLWIGTRRGFAKWRGGELSTVRLPSELTQLHIANAFVDSSGDLWFALGNGAGYRLHRGQLVPLAALKHGSIKWFFETSAGELWIGHEFGLYRKANGKIEQIVDPAFAAITGSHFITHYLAPDGTLWLGTTTGIARYRSGKFEVFTSANGLAADYIDRMVTDSQGNLWCGGRDGCFVVAVDELDRFAEGDLPRFTSRRVEMLQGVGASSHGPKTCLAADGTMWMAANRGVVKVSAEKVPVNLVPPKVHIASVTLNGYLVDTRQPFEFLSGRHRLAFDFDAVSFSDPGNVKIQYQLDGYDAEWLEATNERVAHYTDLGPGQYAFRVTASNEDGVPSSSAAAMHFSVLPRWFQTTWFWAGSSLGLCGLIVAWTSLYTQAVKRRNANLQREIDERKATETKLTRVEKRFLDLAETTQAIPWEADAKTFQFSFVGNQAVEILGYTVAEWLTEDFWVEHLHLDDRLGAVSFRQRATQRRESHESEYRLIASDDSIVWIHDVVQVVEKNGQVVKLRGFMVDVTPRRLAEEESREYLSQLARINRVASMGELATSIAHEVNQPLFAIVSNAQTAVRLLDRVPPDLAEVRSSLNDIVSDGNRASSIIDHVRALVRKDEPNLEPLDMNQVAREAIHCFEAEIRRRGLILTTDFSSELPAIRGDTVGLQQVILNLIINGAQAMHEMRGRSGVLTVSTVKEDGSVVLAVSDQGIGIEPGNVGHMFEPFFTTKTDGTGMGLAINRTIIESHGGSIWATPNKDGGATFSFRLPAFERAMR